MDRMVEMCIRDRSYVEKPLDMKELKLALGEAVETRRTMSTRLAASRSHEKEQLGHLTLLLTEPEPESLCEAVSLVGSLGLPITSSTCICAQMCIRDRSWLLR